jgi:hypothetical protein
VAAGLNPMAILTDFRDGAIVPGPGGLAPLQDAMITGTISPPS